MFFVCAALVANMVTGTLFANPDVLADRDRAGEPAATAALVREYRQLPAIVRPAWKNLDTKWTYALGDPKEGLNTSLSSMPTNLVPMTLPDRSLHADTPYWYVTDVEITEPSMLNIGADDGAQLYVEGQRIPIQGEWFPVSGAPGLRHMIVRVINKAVYGGLGGVSIASRQDCDRYLRQSALRNRLDAVVRKTRLLLTPTSKQIDAAINAVREDTDQSVTAAEKALASEPLTVVGPYLQDAASDRMSIVWETDVRCAATVDWGEGYTLDKTLIAQNDGMMHIAELRDLKPGATYSYRVHSGPDTSLQYTFRTLPTEGPFEFTASSDAHSQEVPFRQNTNLMRRYPIAFTVGVGDMVEDGNRKEKWMTTLQAAAPLATQVPFIIVPGNHDYDRCFEDLHSPYLEQYARSKPNCHYFAWSAGNARFVALDPNIYFPTGIPSDSDEYRWFIHELNSPEWKQATWHFVFLHQPPFSQGWTDYQGDLPIRAMFDPLYEKYGIDFVIAGHTHDYERLTLTYGSQKVHFLIVGGAGGGLEDGPLTPTPVMDKIVREHLFGLFRVDKNKVDLQVIGTDNLVLDRFEATK
jgi:hypothetical protein